MDHSLDMPVEAPVDTLTYHQGWELFPELTDREKVVLCAVADICRQTLGMPFESHGTLGLTHGVSGDALRDLLIFQGDHAALQLHLSGAARHLTLRERVFCALTAVRTAASTPSAFRGGACGRAACPEQATARSRTSAALPVRETAHGPPGGAVPLGPAATAVPVSVRVIPANTAEAAPHLRTRILPPGNSLSRRYGSRRRPTRQRAANGSAVKRLKVFTRKLQQR